MRYLLLLFVLPLLIFASGCSCTNQIEREDFTSSDAREIFIEGHPESSFQENIRNGEIIRGMNEDEVIAQTTSFTTGISTRKGFQATVSSVSTKCLLITGMTPP